MHIHIVKSFATSLLPPYHKHIGQYYRRVSFGIYLSAHYGIARIIDTPFSRSMRLLQWSLLTVTGRFFLHHTWCDISLTSSCRVWRRHCPRAWCDVYLTPPFHVHLTIFVMLRCLFWSPHVHHNDTPFLSPHSWGDSTWANATDMMHSYPICVSKHF